MGGSVASRLSRRVISRIEDIQPWRCVCCEGDSGVGIKFVQSATTQLLSDLSSLGFELLDLQLPLSQRQFADGLAHVKWRRLARSRFPWLAWSGFFVRLTGEAWSGPAIFSFGGRVGTHRPVVEKNLENGFGDGDFERLGLGKIGRGRDRGSEGRGLVGKTAFVSAVGDGPRSFKAAWNLIKEEDGLVHTFVRGVVIKLASHIHVRRPNGLFEPAIAQPHGRWIEQLRQV